MIEKRRIAKNPPALLALLSLAVAAPLIASAQVSLATVVDLAQRNSSAVKIAEADVLKTQAAYDEARDVIIPSLIFGSGIPAFPEVGFTGQPPSLWNATIQSLVFSIPQKHYIAAARTGQRASAARLKDAREQVALDASVAYIELDTVTHELKNAQQQEEYAARLAQIEQQRAEAGVDSPSELLQAKLTAANIHLLRVRLEARSGSLAKQLSVLTGLPVGSITPDHASIPDIPQLRGDAPVKKIYGVESARMMARSKYELARGDEEVNLIPQLSFALQYNRNTKLLNNVDDFFKKDLPANNLSSGFSIELPIFDMVHRAKARDSAADALRAKVEAEEAQRQNDLQVEEMNGSLRELDAQAEVASLKQQIANEQLKTVEAELESGNGAGAAPGAPAQLSPKAEQLARIDERQKYTDSLDAQLELAKARLSLLRALGHMQDWLNELHTK